MKEFFLAALLFLFKNGAALIFANFLGIFCQQGSSSRNHRNFKYAGGSPPLQPKEAAQLLLDGVKIEPCTIIIMGCTQYF
jgi:hypothetical protein